MTTVDPTRQVALALQAQIAALRGRDRAQAGIGRKAGPAHPGRIASTVAQGVQAIAPEDPDRRQKAVRIFLQAELVREFGDALLNDPQFHTMLDAVQEQMQQDQRTAAAVNALGDLLLAGRVPG